MMAEDVGFLVARRRDLRVRGQPGKDLPEKKTGKWHHGGSIPHGETTPYRHGAYSCFTPLTYLTR